MGEGNICFQIMHVLLTLVKPYLCQCSLMFLVSGYGIFATKPHARGSFLLIYPGVLMSEGEAVRLPVQDYIYFFQWQGKEYA